LGGPHPLDHKHNELCH